MAIKAEELRLNNLVSLELETGEIVSATVEKLETPEFTKYNTGDENFMVVEASDTFYDVSDNELFGIELNERILLKCGFEVWRKDTNWIEFRIGNYILHFRTTKDCANNFGIIGSNDGIYYFNWNTVYLHQLQNLYYSLTNTHLTFKP